MNLLYTCKISLIASKTARNVSESHVKKIHVSVCTTETFHLSNDLLESLLLTLFNGMVCIARGECFQFSVLIIYPPVLCDLYIGTSLTFNWVTDLLYIWHGKLTCVVPIQLPGFLWSAKLGQSGHILEV